MTALGSAARVLRRCDELAAISSMEGGIERIYLSPEHARATALVAGWFEAAGMRAWADAAGNAALLGCSDVIIITDDGKTTAYYVNKDGFINPKIQVIDKKEQIFGYEAPEQQEEEEELLPDFPRKDFPLLELMSGM